MKKLILNLFAFLNAFIKKTKKNIRYYRKKGKYDRSGRDIIVQQIDSNNSLFRIRDHSLTWKQIKGIKVRKGIGTLPLSVDVFGMKKNNHHLSHHFNKKSHGFYLKKRKRHAKIN